MDGMVKVRLVRACEMVVGRKIYRLGDELELTAELATMYAARGDVEPVDVPGDQAAEALEFLAMSGFNAEQAAAALPGVISLATSTPATTPATKKTRAKK